MATKTTPNGNGQTRQLNRGDKLGEIYSSRNIDPTTNLGKIVQSKPVERLANASDLDNDAIVGFSVDGSDVLALTDNDLYRVARATGVVTKDTDASPITNAQDIVRFNGNYLISESTDIDSWDGNNNYDENWWTGDTSGTSLTDNVPHIMHVSYEDGETLAVTNGNKLFYYNVTDGHTELSNMVAHHTANCLTSGINTNWVGTYTEDLSGAMVYTWRTGNDEFDQKYHVDAQAVLSMETIDDTPYLITDRGDVKQFNGVGFVTVATFDLANNGLFAANDGLNLVHPKGLRRFGDNLLCYINTEFLDGGATPRYPTGLYEINPRTGSITHRATNGNTVQGDAVSPLLVLNDRYGRFYFGGSQDVVTGSDSEGIWRENLSSGTTRSVIVLTEQTSESFEDTFSSINIACLKSDDERIVVKYRQSKSLTHPIKADINWVSANAFTTTDDISNAVVGDEIEIRYGHEAGLCAHITEIVATTNTYRVTVDTTLGTKGEQSNIFIDNWRKLAEMTISNGIERISNETDGNSNQYKIYIEGSDVEIGRMVEKTVNKRQLK